MIKDILRVYGSDTPKIMFVEGTSTLEHCYLHNLHEEHNEFFLDILDDMGIKNSSR